MRISIGVTNYSWSDGRSLRRSLADLVRAADDTGIDTVWVPDHLIQADPTVAPDQRDMLEAYTTLGFLAAHAERVRLGAMVSPVTFRRPALLVKAVDTVHALTDGRAWFGVGAGYLASEAADMGMFLPGTGERFERLTETIEIALRMWSGDETPYVGEHYRLDHPQAWPRPAVRPRILIGGTGPKRTLPLVARYADACNVFDIPDGGVTVRRNLAVLAEQCEVAGRPYDEIEKTLSTRLAPGEEATAFAARCATFAEWGIDHVCVVSSTPWTPDRIAVLAS